MLTNKILPAPRRTSRRRSRWQSRRAAAAVECALCIPLVVALMFATLEVCAGMYLKESLTVAAFEGVRVGVRRRGTRDNILDRAGEILESRGVVDFNIEIEPESFDNLNALDPVTVTITAPTAGNSLYIFDFIANRDVSARVVMVREFDSDTIN